LLDLIGRRNRGIMGVKTKTDVRMSDRELERALLHIGVESYRIRFNKKGLQWLSSRLPKWVAYHEFDIYPHILQEVNRRLQNKEYPQ
jgi:hypothetical protein